jgi:hypothetical protein
MNYADQVGLFNVVQAMNRFARIRWMMRNLAACASVGPPAAEGKTFN